MNARQTALYVHNIVIYKPTQIDFLSVRDIRALTYASAPIATVKGYLNTKPEISQDSFIGRMLASGTFVSVCEISLEASVDVDTNYMVYFSNTGHPNDKEWYHVIGNPKVKNWRANKLTIYVQRALRPKFI